MGPDHKFRFVPVGIQGVMLVEPHHCRGKVLVTSVPPHRVILFGPLLTVVFLPIGLGLGLGLGFGFTVRIRFRFRFRFWV